MKHNKAIILLCLTIISISMVNFFITIKEPPVQPPVTVSLIEDISIEETPKPNRTPLNGNYEFPKGYYYGQLNEAEQQVYNQIVAASKQYVADIDITPIPYESIVKVYYAVAYDSPEFFWMTCPSVRVQDGIASSIIFNIPADARETSKKIDIMANEIIRDMPEGLDDYGKSLYLYRWITSNTEYDHADNEQNILSVFFTHKSVCAGYSKAFLYLCKKANISCAYVVGYTDEDVCHAWNLLKINNNYYWTDVTWGDSSLFANRYKYLFAPDSSFLAEHLPNKYVATKKYTSDNVFFYPECVDDTHTGIPFFFNNFIEHVKFSLF